ncbi:hypothetical protein J6590_107633, partial [Homalodisca vitripennis]
VDIGPDWGSVHDSDVDSDVGEEFDNQVAQELILSNNSDVLNNEEDVVKSEVEQEEINNYEVVDYSAE